MELLAREDIYYLEHKYHMPEAPFNPFRRYLYHGLPYPENGLDDEQMSQALEARFAQVSHLPHPVAKAHCFAFVCQNMRIEVSPHDYYVGLYNWGRPLRFLMERWKQEAFAPFAEQQRLVSRYTATGTCALWPDFDHVIPDWQSLLRLGFGGLAERAEDYRRRHSAPTPEQTAYYDAIAIAFGGILQLLERLEQWALTHPGKPGVAESLHRLRTGAPKTTLDALQAIYLFFMLCEHVDNYQTRSLGNGLDETLRPFLEADRAAGIPDETLDRQLAYFLKQFDAIGNYWGHPLYLGGSDARGRCLVSEASYRILRVHEALGLYNPKIQLKVSRATPVDFLDMAFRRIRDGGGSFVFCCEPAYVAAVQSYGGTLEEARTCEISGCYETRVRHNESSTVVGYVNALMPVLLALNGGRVDGEQLGPETGETFDTFEAFLQAYLTQWQTVIQNAMAVGTQMYDPALAVVNPSLMYSATITGSLERGVDGYAYGCKFNNSSLLNCGFASAVDALLAVRELVYDKKLVTLPELRRALAADWVGYETLRARALSCPHKYGNADPEADALAVRLSGFFTGLVNGVPNGRGGVYKAMLHSARMFIEQGKKLGATPDGRRAGEEESKNASPSVGMDRRGVTALMRSALALGGSSYPESACLDVMLHPAAVEGEEGLTVLRSLLYTYMDEGGMALQFNIFSADTLRDAQKNPEKYRNLQVRVCGWNVLWSNMSPAEQAAYIRRAENIC